MEQNVRMKNVVDDIKRNKKIKSDAVLAEQLSNATDPPVDIDPNLLSKYCNSVKKIPEAFLKLLHDVYQVNPNFIQGTSDCMYDDAEIKYSKFIDLVDDWQIVFRGNDESYLHLFLDSDFYTYLIEKGNAEILQEKGLLGSDVEEKIKCKYNNSQKQIEEYVLLPRSRFIDIVKESIETRKFFEELINPFLYESCLDDANATFSPLHKKDN